MTVAAAEGRLLWDSVTGFAPAPDRPAGLLAADSWLVEDGRVRGIEHHVSRFSGACVQLGLSQDTLERFWQGALAALPRTGAWFPRTELREDGSLALWIRPAPPLLGGVRILTWGHPDPRATPRRKGPDLGLLAEVKTLAQAAGADDALFTTPDGRATESTTASLLWWEGYDLCLPDTEDHLLPGVTRILLVRQALESGVVVRRSNATPEDLYDREVWLVNALHGIRPVTEWVGAGREAHPAGRAPRWQRLLRARARALTDPRTSQPPSHALRTTEGSPS
ncbi:aminotransferase class IV [Streptomyces sp. NBC_01565]|uniref:aminotransferase class IV n=1 Tax=unclassified Streptomyces TaxID=2593676 RepID=UPI00224DD924|nr:aminotransferase class IV [Streptomyces sp. NBC_01565]MCX4545896.1 aminotransferase class IV [Streptomyces sp. NBC_01565]